MLLNARPYFCFLDNFILTVFFQESHSEATDVNFGNLSGVVRYGSHMVQTTLLKYPI